MITLTQKQKTAVLTAFAIGGVVIVLAFYFFMMIGKKTIATKTEQTAKLQEKAGKLNMQLKEMAELNNLKGSFDQIEARLNRISQRLPSTPEAPGFLNALSSALRATGISTKKLAPDKENDFGKFTEIPYSVDAVGRYHEIGQFLNLVEENPQRFMRLKSLKITNDPERPSLHPVSMGIATFMFVEN